VWSPPIAILAAAVPIYEYKCANGHVFEVIQSMSDDPVTACEVCGAPVERVFHPVAVHFKGSGFYTTDYAKKGAAKSASDGSKSEGSSDSKKSDSGSKSDSGTKTKSESGSKD
jgi:putative FmdB family regulatory protein